MSVGFDFCADWVKPNPMVGSSHSDVISRTTMCTSCTQLFY